MMNIDQQRIKMLTDYDDEIDELAQEIIKNGVSQKEFDELLKVVESKKDVNTLYYSIMMFCKDRKDLFSILTKINGFLVHVQEYSRNQEFDQIEMMKSCLSAVSVNMNGIASNKVDKFVIDISSDFPDVFLQQLELAKLEYHRKHHRGKLPSSWCPFCILEKQEM